jgi:hypothetical protein
VNKKCERCRSEKHEAEFAIKSFRTEAVVRREKICRSCKAFDAEARTKKKLKLVSATVKRCIEPKTTVSKSENFNETLDGETSVIADQIGLVHNNALSKDELEAIDGLLDVIAKAFIEADSVSLGQGSVFS